MSDPGVISLPGVLKNLKKIMIFTSNGGHSPFTLIRQNRAGPWKSFLNTKAYPLM